MPDSNGTNSYNTAVMESISYPEITGLEIHHIIGKGGSGTVYKGCQPYLHRDVAIKVLHIAQDDDTFIKRFHREAQILARLNHANIVACYQAGITDNTPSSYSMPYIAMEYINGPSLLELISKNGKLNQVQALSIGRDIASALNYVLKKNIIHRDIKAENILLKPLKEKKELRSTAGSFHFTPKLADLGIARTCRSDHSEDLTASGFLIGTPSSMAPEQFNEPDNIDFKCDIYGLGCLLFHMLTGQKPYRGKNLTELIISKNSGETVNPITLEPTLDKSLASLVSSMLAKEKDDRPASYDDILRQLQVILDRLEKQNRVRLKRKWPLIISVTFMMCLGVGLLLVLYKPEETSEMTAGMNATQKATKAPETSLSISTKETVKIESQTITNSEPLEISFFDKKTPLLPGEAFQILIRPEKDAFVYCYFEDQAGDIVRFFPNRFQKNALIRANSPVTLPGQMPFNLNASQEGVTELIICFASDNDIAKNIPKNLYGTDFNVLPFSSLNQVRNLYSNISKNILHEQFLEIKVVKK